MKSTAGWIGQVFSWLVIFCVLGLIAVCIGIPRVGGATPYTILTSSMKSSYPPGTLVVAKPTPIDSIVIGDVITFQLKPGKPDVATHRVIGVTSDPGDGTTRLITQGDDNDSPDPDQVRAVQLKGKLWYAVPVVGRVNIALDKAQHQLATVIGGGALLLYAAYMFTSATLDKRRPTRTHRKTEVKT